ncbi:MAG: hypothetical protein WCD70_14520 [Alphaproteobacteria bacterium]
MSNKSNKDKHLVGVSPITLAYALMPSWMKSIKDFDGLEIMPCKLVGYNPQGQEIVTPCELNQVSFWTVYGHYSANSYNVGIQALDDFQTKAEAQKFHDRLIDIYPHLDDWRPQPRKLPPSQFTP